MILEVIQQRRSVFPPQYNDKPISKETISQLLEAANWAPNHAKTQPWRFKVVLGQKKADLGQFLSNKYEETAANVKQQTVKKLKENAEKSAAVIAICMQRDPKERIPEWEEVAATAMAVQNIWLACTSKQIGTYWSSPGIIKYADEFFDLAEGEKCLGFLYMGYFDGDLPQGQREPIADRVAWLAD